jgi:hypothetical protein
MGNSHPVGNNIDSRPTALRKPFINPPCAVMEITGNQISRLRDKYVKDAQVASI